MSDDRIPRREFLVRALGACGSPLLAELAFAGGTLGQPQGLTGEGGGRRVAASYLGASSVIAAQAIGEAYGRYLGVGRDADAILRAAAGTLELIGTAADEDGAVEMLADAVRRDFIERRTVQLEGWVLSRTELDLCLLTLR